MKDNGVGVLVVVIERNVWTVFKGTGFEQVGVLAGSIGNKVTLNLKQNI